MCVCLYIYMYIQLNMIFFGIDRDWRKPKWEHLVKHWEHQASGNFLHSYGIMRCPYNFKTWGIEWLLPIANSQIIRGHVTLPCSQKYFGVHLVAKWTSMFRTMSLMLEICEDWESKLKLLDGSDGCTRWGTPCESVGIFRVNREKLDVDQESSNPWIKDHEISTGEHCSAAHKPAGFL